MWAPSNAGTLVIFDEVGEKGGIENILGILGEVQEMNF